ncbi:unnamed protein product [Thlaspi arvense]|uniref:Inositol-tetrakisphosphate 1-kinase n=1 Tax=Thlaspi arvense TaxID=13288 RepID=A0AAU9RVB5_THLAR|nr:unnamed protein product [Thlaspi arvense]
MRVEGDNMVPQRNETDEEVVLNTASFQQVQQQQKQKLVIGYALTSKKKKSFLQPKLEVLARKKGISFVSIDQDKPLSEQGPFDVVLHKLLGNEWHDVIEDYQQNHPEVTVLDPPGAIQRIYNRQSMLQGIADLNLAECDGMICVPKQMVVLKDTTSSADEVEEAGLKFPLVAKPLLVDGTAKSHQLFLAYDRLSLAELEPPLVLQEFVNHVVAAELPPKPLLERLVRELRSRLGLRLFNIDMIREHGSKDVFYVIDINYFPGKVWKDAGLRAGVHRFLHEPGANEA